MKSFRRSSMVLGFLLSMASIPAAHAEFKCNKPHLNRVDTMACAKAAEGIDSLRRFVSITRGIYGLQVTDYVQLEWDFVQKPSSASASPDAQKVSTEVASTVSTK